MGFILARQAFFVQDDLNIIWILHFLQLISICRSTIWHLQLHTRNEDNAYLQERSDQICNVHAGFWNCVCINQSCSGYTCFEVSQYWTLLKVSQGVSGIWPLNSAAELQILQEGLPRERSGLVSAFVILAQYGEGWDVILDHTIKRQSSSTTVAPGHWSSWGHAMHWCMADATDLGNYQSMHAFSLNNYWRL